MFALKIERILAGITLILLLTACGQVGTVLSSSGTYRVSATVDTYTLDECAIVRSESEISPYFSTSIAGDPDIIGLTVSLQTMGGALVGKKVRYTFSSRRDATQKYNDGYDESSNNRSDPPYGGVLHSESASTGSGSAFPDSGFTDFASVDSAAAGSAGFPDSVSADSLSADSASSGSGFPDSVSTGSASSGSAGFPESASADSGATDSASTGSDFSDFTSTGSNAAGSTSSDSGFSESASTDSNAAGSAFSDSGFSESASADSTRTDGSSAVASDSTDTQTAGASSGETDAALGIAAPQSFPEISPESPEIPAEPLPKPSRKKILANRMSKDEDLVIEAGYVDKKLPPFIFAEDLEIGQYSLVFQVQGEGRVLERIAKTIFFLADAQFNLNDIQTYLPGSSEGSSIIPPGLPIMLEAQVAADRRLEPYVIWYNGKNRINEGPISQGVHRFLWQTPNQTSFQVLRVEAFPFRPSVSAGTALGRVKELSLPISAKQEKRASVVEASDEYIRRYQFLGNLQENKSSGDTGKNLLPARGTSPQWLPHAGIYGLALNAGNWYTIPGSFFTVPGENRGIGQMLFRIALRSEGYIFTGSFNLQETAEETLDIDLVYIGDSLSLIYTAGNESRQEEVWFNADETGEFITAVLNFRIEPDRFYAGLSLRQNDDTLLEEQSIPLAAPVSGIKAFTLGPGAPRPKETSAAPSEKTSAPKEDGTADETTETPVTKPVLSTSGRSDLPIMIIDELAIAYTLEPIIPESPAD